MPSGDGRIVMTLDAGGTNLVFGAVRGGAFIAGPVSRPSEAGDLDRCLSAIAGGFAEVARLLPEKPAAISFAFPGPADYARGVIGGNLPSFPSFRGGVALGPYLEGVFGIPVFINNDGHLFAYGEALAGALPRLNRRLEEAGSPRRYRNLVGVTLGTGFGCGIVADGRLLTGDNGVGSGLWCFRSCLNPGWIVDENVSARAIRRGYAGRSGDARPLTPGQIAAIAEGRAGGDRGAAAASFEEFGHCAGDALAAAVSLVDGAVVIGGGIAGAAGLFMPALLRSMASELAMGDGTSFPRLQSEPVYVRDEASFRALAAPSTRPVRIYRSDRYAEYEDVRKTPVMISGLGASAAISLGAYHFALGRLRQGA